MLIAQSAAEFESFAAGRGLSLREPSSINAVAEAWLAFFANARASDTTTEDGAWPDALLFEFGYREAVPGYYGSCFYLNLTRQFISCDGEDDDAMFQLVWQAEYEPTEHLLALGQKTEWCDSLQSLAHFREEVLSSPVLLVVATTHPLKTEYYLTGV
jgi:hypothetical protein